MSHSEYTNLGVGLGLREPHLPEILAIKPKVPWFEVLGDNFFSQTGVFLHGLESLRKDYPLSLHFVGMSIGSCDSINYDYLRQVRELKGRLNPLWVSDHLCWSSVHGVYLHNLLPLPFTEEALNHVVQRIQQVQEFLGERIVIENVSSYLEYEHSSMSEVEFVSAVAEKSDCFLLVDVSNILVNSINQRVDINHYLATLPSERIVELHLGGYHEQDGYILDDHGGPISDAAIALYQKVLNRFGPRATIIEWDQDLPTLEGLVAERARVERRILKSEGAPVYNEVS